MVNSVPRNERTGSHEEFGVDFHSMPASENGHKTILTIVDLFSGYTQYVPCREESAKEFVRAFAKNVIFRTGAPMSIRSDHAPQFLADVSKLLYEKLGMTHTTTKGYHPEGNSTAEIAHAFLGNCLRAMSDENYKEWCEELPAIQHARNMTFSERTQCTPFELHHGVKARSATQLALMGNRPPPDTSTVLASVQRHVQLCSALARTHSNCMRKLTARKLNGEEIPTSSRTRRAGVEIS